MMPAVFLAALESKITPTLLEFHFPLVKMLLQLLTPSRHDNEGSSYGDVKAELGTQGISMITNTSGPHAAFKCEFCHRIEAGASSGDNAYSELVYTNATPTSDNVAVSRKLVVGLMDMEASNTPTQMTPADTYATLRVALTKSGNPLYRSTSATGAQLSVSPCYPATAAGVWTQQYCLHQPRAA